MIAIAYDLYTLVIFIGQPTACISLLGLRAGKGNCRLWACAKTNNLPCLNLSSIQTGFALFQVCLLRLLPHFQPLSLQDIAGSGHEVSKLLGLLLLWNAMCLTVTTENPSQEAWHSCGAIALFLFQLSLQFISISFNFC